VPIAGNKKLIGSQVRRTAPSRPATINRRVSVVAEANAKHGKVKKCVLAYSGGLDTSIILKWLQDEYGCEVITFTADLGQVRRVLC
jgi:PP-loop superfamily ATP-utilizing enzyme